MDLGKELGIKSYCLRDFKDNRTVVKMLKECSVDRLDISGTHFNLTAPDAWDDVFATYRHGDIPLIGMTAGLTDDAGWNRRIFQFAQRVSLPASRRRRSPAILEPCNSSPLNLACVRGCPSN